MIFFILMIGAAFTALVFGSLLLMLILYLFNRNKPLPHNPDEDEAQVEFLKDYFSKKNK